MQHVSTIAQPRIWNGGGGRVSSPEYRHSLKQSEDFMGLESDTNRYELLLLVKKAGKAAGFTPRMIALLDYYMAYTRDHDWEKGNRPIVYQSVAKTALAMDVSERQIQKLEQKLFEVGAITWNASGNHKRYGARDPETDRLLFAYGVELTPLAYLEVDLKIKVYEKQREEREWISTRREISALRGQIRSLLLEMREEGGDLDQITAFERDYQEIAFQLRTHIDLATMHELLQSHQSLHGRLMEQVADVEPVAERRSEAQQTLEETSKGSLRSEPEFAHYKYSNPAEKKDGSPPDPAWQKSVAEPSELLEARPAGELKHVTLPMVVSASSERFRAYLPLSHESVTWSDFSEAAYQMRSELFISQRSWGEACQVLGRVGASLCVLITDRARDRGKNPVVRPAAYFQGMVKKARRGELRLQNTVFGLLTQAK